tara:strand:- start:325 stop:1164 length:840 start_codon:yes stop_codon:yes gene_type:complete
MAFNKIQPEQIQLHTFFSDSGDLNITQTNTGVQINVSRNLTGDFAFTGDLLSNGKSVFGLPNTGDNTFSIDSGNLLIQGKNVDIGANADQGDNIVIKAVNSNVSGSNNLLLNGSVGNFGVQSQNNTVLAGKNTTVDVTGSVVITDFTASSVTPNSNGFYVSFDTGHYFLDGQNYFQNHVSFQNSGIVSGDFEIIGDGILSGSTIVNQAYLEKKAGGDQNISGTYIYETGFQLPKWQGNQSSAGTDEAPATGALAISGSTLLVYVGASAWRGVAISGATP